MIKIKALLAKITAKLVTLDSDVSTAQGDISSLQTATAVSTGTGTFNTSITATRHTCNLLKIGNVVFCEIGLGNATSTVSASTTLFTVPSGFRPAAQTNFAGMGNSGIECDMRVTTGGVITQRTFGDATNIYSFTCWTV